MLKSGQNRKPGEPANVGLSPIALAAPARPPAVLQHWPRRKEQTEGERRQGARCTRRKMRRNARYCACPRLAVKEARSFYCCIACSVAVVLLQVKGARWLEKKTWYWF